MWDFRVVPTALPSCPSPSTSDHSQGPAMPSLWLSTQSWAGADGTEGQLPPAHIHWGEEGRDKTIPLWQREPTHQPPRAPGHCRGAGLLGGHSLAKAKVKADPQVPQKAPCSGCGPGQPTGPTVPLLMRPGNSPSPRLWPETPLAVSSRILPYK